jgi:hypothetical protein
MGEQVLYMTDLGLHSYAMAMVLNVTRYELYGFIYLFA